MGLSHSPRIVTDGLVFCVDAGDKMSYPGAGTTWTDLSKEGNNTTLVNGKFRQISHNGVKIFSRHFSPQEYMKMGYGLNNPVTTFRIIVGKLFHSFSKKSWDVNPTQDWCLIISKKVKNIKNENLK